MHPILSAVVTDTGRSPQPQRIQFVNETFACLRMEIPYPPASDVSTNVQLKNSARDELATVAQLDNFVVSEKVE